MPKTAVLEARWWPDPSFRIEWPLYEGEEVRFGGPDSPPPAPDLLIAWDEFIPGPYGTFCWHKGRLSVRGRRGGGLAPLYFTAGPSESCEVRPGEFFVIGRTVFGVKLVVPAVPVPAPVRPAADPDAASDLPSAYAPIPLSASAPDRPRSEVSEIDLAGSAPEADGSVRSPAPPPGGPARSAHDPLVLPGVDLFEGVPFPGKPSGVSDDSIPPQTIDWNPDGSVAPTTRPTVAPARSGETDRPLSLVDDSSLPPGPRGDLTVEYAGTLPTLDPPPGVCFDDGDSTLAAADSGVLALLRRDFPPEVTAPPAVPDPSTEATLLPEVPAVPPPTVPPPGEDEGTIDVPPEPVEANAGDADTAGPSVPTTDLMAERTDTPALEEDQGTRGQGEEGQPARDVLSPGPLVPWSPGPLQAVEPPAPTEAPTAAATAVWRRQTDVSFPARVPLGRPHHLRVALVSADRPPPHTYDVAVALNAPAGAESVTVTVCVAAENFAIDGPTRATITVPREGPSAAVNFVLRGLAVGPGRVMVDFEQDGRPVGSVDLEPLVGAADSTPAERPAAGVGAVCPVAGPAVAPDAVLKVFTLRHGGGPGRLQFVLASSHPALRDLPTLDGDLGTQDLRADVRRWVGQHLTRAGEVARDPGAAPGDFRRALADLGYNLFDQLLTPEVRDLYWTLRERGVERLLVLSDEPDVPWELVRPYRLDPLTGEMDRDEPCWGETFALSRWLRGRPPEPSLRGRRVVAAAAGGGGTTRDLFAEAPGERTDGDPLPGAEAEVSGLPDALPAAQVRRLPARRRAVLDALAAGDFDVFHLACHGSDGPEADADGAAVLLDDGRLSVADLSPRLAAALRKAGPLMVVNACHAGRAGPSLTRPGGWGPRLVQLGCAAFVGPLWPVEDRAAAAFTREFYAALAGGQSLGEAARAARRAVAAAYPDDPTGWAYCCFGDPAARLV
jgi:hypothetical protein